MVRPRRVKVTTWSQSHWSAGVEQPGNPQPAVPGGDEPAQRVRGPVPLGAEVEQGAGAGVDQPADPVPVRGHRPGQRGRDRAVAGDLTGPVRQPEQGRQVDHHRRGLRPTAPAPRQPRQPTCPPGGALPWRRRLAVRVAAAVGRAGRAGRAGRLVVLVVLVVRVVMVRVVRVGAAVAEHGVHQGVDPQRVQPEERQPGQLAGRPGRPSRPRSGSPTGPWTPGRAR